ncbi:hypothetical protein DJ568_08830 [Mucilaginibacter hurinus]|uniref:DUF4369 domain-containing protein n=1 Tax=Mucilaginibacter hurinus TaxID=2201324 RepID=A0A367GP73_9SPHI|nr:hypothetical protein [Mucilaginibacter hurinus]RCH55277.1 hypothetical protein DJ568_08830 [Mucilaginibacter hurinus]
MRSVILLAYLLITCFAAKAQLFSGSFKKGFYYNDTGVKVPGTIKPEQTFILFKQKGSSAEQQISAGDIKGYVIATDSFTVSHNAILGKPHFLKVLINNATKLYFYRADEKVNFETYAKEIPAGATTNFKKGTGKERSKYYFYGKTPNALLLLNDQNFVEVMSGIMADKPEIVERIKDKTVNLDNLNEWVIFYNKEKADYPPALGN